MKYPKGMQIIRKMLKGRKDSFWYEGDIATYDGYTLIACGDIDVRANAEVPHSCKWEDIAAEVKTDKGLEKLVGSIEGDSPGAKKYYWVNNNWFEVLLPDGSSVLGDVAYDYDEAIRLLIAYAKEKI